MKGEEGVSRSKGVERVSRLSGDQQQVSRIRFEKGDQGVSRSNGEERVSRRTENQQLVIHIRFHGSGRKGEQEQR